MSKEAIQSEMKMWTRYYHADKDDPSFPFRSAINLLATKNLGISIQETSNGFEIYCSALSGARALNRVKYSYEMQAMNKASHTDGADNVPNFDFCDWDDETIVRVKGWRLTRLIKAYKEHERYWETVATNYEQKGETEKLSLAEEDRIKRNMSHLKNLKITLNSLEVELPQVLQGLPPFEDTDIKALVEEIVERELQVGLPSLH